ncbi:MAG: hypothetical protein WA063_00090 [Minisyncoccia bacterium]
MRVLGGEDFGGGGTQMIPLLRGVKGCVNYISPTQRCSTGSPMAL